MDSAASLLEAYRRDRRRLLGFLLSAAGGHGRAVDLSRVDLDSVSADYALDCIASGTQFDASEATRRYFDDRRYPIMTNSPSRNSYFLLSRPEVSGSPPKRVAPDIALVPPAEEKPSRTRKHSDSYRVATDVPGSIAKHLESANTMFSFVWWIIGFYWISAGAEDVIRDAPQLYWLCIVFLAFDVFFVVFCVALACIIGIAVCCCLPCIIAILYAVSDQEGASDDDIRQIPKYKFHRVDEPAKDSVDATESSGGIMTECGTNQPIEKALAAEDAECCICISAYDDGAELRELPCGHHFHCTCIDKWLHINATCPLCKFSICKSGSSSGSEEV